MNHPGPLQAPEGFTYVPAAPVGWQIAVTGHHCHFGSGGDGTKGRGRKACGKPAVAEHQTKHLLQPLRPYCAGHLLAKTGLMVHDGRFWALRQADGSPVPDGKMCTAHGVLRSQCPGRHPRSFRAFDAQWDAVAATARRRGLSAAAGVEAVVEAWLAEPEARVKAVAERTGLAGRKVRPRQPDGSRRMRGFACTDKT